MSFLRMSRSWCFVVHALLLAVGILLLVVEAALAGQPWWPGKQSAWPWEKRPKIHGYDENRPAVPPPANVTRPPLRYTITITVLPPRDAQAETDTASIIAHLPEDALLWIDDYQTRQSGMLRHFESPP